MSQGNHPYRKQTQTVNIPDHLLPQIFVDQQQRPKGPQELGANGQGQPRANKPYPRVNTSTAVSPAGPEVAPFQSPVLQHYHEQQSQQQQAPYPIDTEYPSSRFLSTFQAKTPNIHQFNTPNISQANISQANTPNIRPSSIPSSLTYRKQNSSQDSFKYSRQNSNGYNDPNQQYNQQFSQQPQPLQHRPIRKPPGNTAPVENRRIVSTPSVPQLAPTNSKFDNRTKSLSSMSQKYQGTYQQPHMQPIQQGQPMKPSHNSKSSVSGSSSSSNSSSNIHHSFSLSSKSRSFTSLSKLSSLSTKKFNSSASSQGKPVDRTVSSGTIASSRTIIQMSKKPSVYPAMLSRVARVFRESIFLTINTKDGLEYHDTFTGKMAVDIICRIIRTNDRNLALLLGRSLDSQKFFHDVTYQHRLRDSIHEVYAFNHIYSDVELYENSIPGSNPDLHWNNGLPSTTSLQSTASNGLTAEQSPISGTGVNGVFTILTDCYSPTCSRNSLCYSIACPRRLEQQARLNMKPQGGLQRAVSRLSLHDQDETKSLWHETVPKSVLDKLDKLEKMRQELIYEFIYTERDYVKDLEFMTDFYIMPLRNPSNNIIPEREREVFIRTVFGGVSDLLRLAKSISEALTRRQQQQKPVIQTIADVFLQFVDKFEPFIQYSGNKVFASFEHERQQQVNMRYASFLDAIEKRPESRKQDLSSFLIKGIQRPARYQLLLGGILKNTQPDSPDYPDLLKAKEEIEKILGKINIQTGESTDRHKIMVLHRLLGKQTLEDKYNFKLSYNNRIIYQVTLNRKRDNEKIDLYLFEHALLLVKHKIQNKREQYKVFEKPIYLPLLFVNSGYDIPTFRTVINSRINGSIMSESKAKVDSINTKLQINFMGLGSQQVHTTLNADDVANQNQVLSQISSQQKKIMAKYDIFSLSKYETRRFTGNNKINCAVPCYGGKKLLYGTDSGVWVSTVRTISITNNEKICSDPTLVISKEYVTQIEVLVEYSKLLVLSDKSLFEFDLSCTDSLDHAKNTRSGRLILSHVSSFKTGICDGKLLVCCIKQGNNHSINIFEPPNPFDKNKNRNKKYDIREITFSSDPISISFLRTRLCIGCTKGFEILSMEDGKKEPILDEADPSLDFATQKEIVNPLAIHRLGKDFLLSYSEFSFLINRNGWRTKHDWGIFWEGNPTNIALFYPYLLSFESNFIEIRDLKTTYLIRALIGENIRFLHSNEHEAMYACEEGGYDVIVSIDFLNLKPKEK
ncbi:RHO1 GDP-GTP exchange protein 2 [Yamadazyma tenuis]|uniref:RHO1 GDP-GTP exchange protein 2 n=1 Tax=Candida tenuis TaxID=2315449 RepID=UPI0027A53A7A|nr:RHO1 GDP-GTP exchange protein 2 [Yamadazyma tenuis]